jgi:hypothetical protein
VNIPADRDTMWTVYIRKLKWMAVGVLIPEYVAVMAITEWWDARFLRKEMQQFCGLRVHRTFDKRSACG